MENLFGPDFRVLGKIGEGSFADVFQVIYRESGRTYAIKRLKKRFKTLEEAEKSEEIAALEALHGHPNIVKLIDVLYEAEIGSLALVFEYMDVNLYEFVRDHEKGYDEPTALILIYQLLKGLEEMHSKNLFHRDVKPENCMINESTLELKLCDFGSTRNITNSEIYTEYVATRWYRAPECILTAGSYGHEVDIWAVGCILYEIVTGKPLFPGKHELDQINRIHSLLGTPSEELLNEFMKCPNIHIEFSFQERKPKKIKSILPTASSATLDLLEQMLIYDPTRRISAGSALNHRAFDVIRASENLWKEDGCPGSFAEFALKEMRRATRKLAASTKLEAKPMLKQVSFAVKGASSSMKVNKNSIAMPPVVITNCTMKETRKIAAERIKIYNLAHVKESKQKNQKKHRPALHLGPTKVVQYTSLSPC